LRSQLRRLTASAEVAYQPTRRGESWQTTILDARRLVADGLEENGSLTRELPACSRGLSPRPSRGGKDTGLPWRRSPTPCPRAVDQVLDEDFWPEA